MSQTVLNQLRPDLADTDFDQLVQLARALLPKYAPLWTDHNLHDPGIMLIELLAFIAEAQIWSLARSRVDERWAYAALLGFFPHGPRPASGAVWPAQDKAMLSRLLPQGSRIKTGLPLAPHFFLPCAVNLSPATLLRVETVLADGSSINHSDANLQPGAVFYPFGDQADAAARLVLTFSGALLAAPEAQPDGSVLQARSCKLCIGVSVAQGTVAAAVPTPMAASVAALMTASMATSAASAAASAVSAAGASAAAPGQAAASGRPCARHLTATLVIDQFSYPLPLLFDTSGGMQQSGVIALSLEQVPALPAGRFRIELAIAAEAFSAAAAISAIQTNVLPVIQRETVRPVPFGYAAQDMHDHVLALELEGLLLENGQPALSLAFGRGQKITPWQRVGGFSEAGPDDTVYVLENGPAAQNRITTQPQLRFGNGINGKLPAAGDIVHVEALTSAGSAGNLAPGQRWSVAGIDGVYGSNPEATAGGQDAPDLADLQRLARASVHNDHAIVTDADLRQGAMAQTALQVARAEALAMPASGGNLPARALVALRVRPAGNNSGNNNSGNNSEPAPETARWLAALRQALLPRMLLGERLAVIAPAYVALEVRATLLAAPGYDTIEVQARVTAMLQDWFRFLPDPSGATVWPLGRAVEVLDVKARLRKVDGVRAIRTCRLWHNGAAQNSVTLPSHGLPLWRDGPGLITVLAS